MTFAFKIRILGGIGGRQVMNRFRPPEADIGLVVLRSGCQRLPCFDQRILSFIHGVRQLLDSILK